MREPIKSEQLFYDQVIKLIKNQLINDPNFKGDMFKKSWYELNNKMHYGLFVDKANVILEEIEKMKHLLSDCRNTGIQDKHGTIIYEDNKVKYDGKEYTIKFFEKYGMFGLSDGGEKPVGRRGSSTKYEPYILNEYYQRRMEVVNE